MHFKLSKNNIWLVYVLVAHCYQPSHTWIVTVRSGPRLFSANIYFQLFQPSSNSKLQSWVGRKTGAGDGNVHHQKYLKRLPYFQ